MKPSYAIVSGEGQTLRLLDSLPDARLCIRHLRYMEHYCSEGNGYTGMTYKIMRGTSAQDWKEVR